MSLIKCPECNKEISSAAKACPHCGYPINNNDIKTNDFSNIGQPQWVNEWKKKLRFEKIILFFIFLAFLVFEIIVIILMNTDLEAVYYSYSQEWVYYTKDVYFVLISIASMLLLLSFSFWVVFLITSKVRVRNCDGYTVLVYNGFKGYLSVENKIHDSSLFNRHLYGKLPNGKNVWVEISVFDGSVKIGFGSEGHEHQII